MPEPTSDVLRSAWPTGSTVVSIEGAAAENRPGTADAPIKFSGAPPTPSSSRDSFERRPARLAGAAEQVRRLSEIADRHQDDLRREVQRVQSTADQDLLTGLRASLIGAALAGRAWPGMDEAALLDGGRSTTAGRGPAPTPRCAPPRG